MPRNPRPEEFRALIALQGTLLKGSPVSLYGPSLGPLKGLLVRDGGWRPDGLARVRQTLNGALAEWVAVEAPARFHAPHSPASARTALAQLWGISTSPHMATDVAAEAGVDRKTIADWAALVTSNAHVLAWLGGRADLDDDPRVPETERPREALNEWVKWPVADRDALIGRMRTLAATDGLQDETLVWALRAAVRTALLSYLKNGIDGGFGRRLARDVFLPWHGDDAGLHERPVSASVDGAARSDYDRTAVLLQLFAFDALDEPKALLAELRARRGNMRLMVRARGSMDRHRPKRLRSETGVFGPRGGASLEIGRRRFEVGQNGGMQELIDMEDLLPSKAEYVGELVKRQDPQVKPAAIHRYLELRRRITTAGLKKDDDLAKIDPRPIADAAAAQFALSDQLVRLEAVHLEEHLLVEEFDRLFADEEAEHLYADLGQRDRGLVVSKGSKDGHGIADMGEARRRVLIALDHGDPGDILERYEQLEQISLSIGGAFTGLLEDSLTRIVHERQIPRSLKPQAWAALQYSYDSLILLEKIAEYSPDGVLQKKRIADHRHISWIGWAETALQNRLRAMIAVRTAIMAGVLPETTQLGAMSSSIETIRSLYCELVALGTLMPATERNLGMQATWFAMLDNGSLPAVEGAGPSLMTLPFLDTKDGEFDIAGSVTWHLTVGDGGTLSRIHPKTLAGRALAQRSPVAFSRWQSGIAQALE